MNRSRTLTRAITFTTGVALGLNLLTGAAFAAPATPDVPVNAAAGVVTADPSPHASGPSDQVLQCSDSHRSNTGNGANNDGGYQSTCDVTDFGGNGQEFGPGLQTGKPCAGCVGNADDKNPPGQFPDGSDRNSGYECDGRDRPAQNQQGNGNQGIGDENPAHTGCASAPVVVVEPELCSDGSVMPESGECSTPEEAQPNPPTCPGENTLPPAADTDGNGMVDLRDCAPPVNPPAFTCEDSDMPATDVNGDGDIDEKDCEAPEETPVFTCEDSEMPATDVNGDGTIDEKDCEAPEETPVFTCDDSEMPATDVDGDGTIDEKDCEAPEETPVFTCDDSEMPATDVNGDGTIDASDCTIAETPETPETPDEPQLPDTVTCPDGSALPMSDVDGNGIITPADCVKPSVEEETPGPVDDETPATPEAEVVTTNVVSTPIEAPAAVLAVEVEQPAAPAEVTVADVVPAAAVTPADVIITPPAAVMPAEVTPAAVTPLRETAVLGVQVERGAAPLARTGAGTVGGQAAVALFLLAVGFGLVRAGRRPAVTVG